MTGFGTISTELLFFVISVNLAYSQKRRTGVLIVTTVTCEIYVVIAMALER
jgi:hypothetical protein